MLGRLFRLGNMRRATVKAGLSSPGHIGYFTRDKFDEIINHLKMGYPVIVHAGAGAYAQKGHYMTILAVREEDNYVYLSDPALTSGTLKDKLNGKQYYADTWITLEDMYTGKIDSYLLVAPPGVY